MGSDPFETGAHDLATEAAGIHEFNLVRYTSILPPESEEVTLKEAKEKYFHHGAVLECIMSETHGARGDRLTAGVGRMMVYKRGNGSGNEKGDRIGGFATEYEGHAAEELAQKELEGSLQDLFDRRYDGKDQEMSPFDVTISSEVVSKSFATAMAGICFVDYIFPELEKDDDRVAVM
ncbi:hypothetical protein N2152v2_007048 [Parachlorella kessleri]